MLLLLFVIILLIFAIEGIIEYQKNLWLGSGPEMYTGDTKLKVIRQESTWVDLNGHVHRSQIIKHIKT